MRVVHEVVIAKDAIVTHIIMVVVLIHTVGEIVFIVMLDNKIVHVVVLN